jgi:pyruvate dehydrogenase E1 component alpha subunit
MDSATACVPHVGGGLPISLGAGLSSKYLKNGRVCISFFGDGASNQGSFHESLNLAAVLDLPVVFVCENNQFALSTPQSYSQRIQNTADRAPAYGIPGVIVDGNNVLAVYEAAVKAVSRARKGQGPTLLECKTWRYDGHFTGDTAAYKDAEEQADWLKKDPLPRYIQYLEDNHLFTAEHLQAIDARVLHEVDEAVRFAAASPLPSPESVGSDVYADMTEEVRSR